MDYYVPNYIGGDEDGGEILGGGVGGDYESFLGGLEVSGAGDDEDPAVDSDARKMMATDPEPPISVEDVEVNGGTEEPNKVEEPIFADEPPTSTVKTAKEPTIEVKTAETIEVKTAETIEVKTAEEPIKFGVESNNAAVKTAEEPIEFVDTNPSAVTIPSPAAEDLPIFADETPSPVKNTEELATVAPIDNNDLSVFGPAPESTDAATSKTEPSKQDSMPTVGGGKKKKTRTNKKSKPAAAEHNSDPIPGEENPVLNNTDLANIQSEETTMREPKAQEPAAELNEIFGVESDASIPSEETPAHEPDTRDPDDKFGVEESAAPDPETHEPETQDADSISSESESESDSSSSESSRSESESDERPDNLVAPDALQRSTVFGGALSNYKLKI